MARRKPSPRGVPRWRRIRSFGAGHSAIIRAVSSSSSRNTTSKRLRSGTERSDGLLRQGTSRKTTSGTPTTLPFRSCPLNSKFSVGVSACSCRTQMMLASTGGMCRPRSSMHSHTQPCAPERYRIAAPVVPQRFSFAGVVDARQPGIATKIVRRGTGRSIG